MYGAALQSYEKEALFSVGMTDKSATEVRRRRLPTPPVQASREIYGTVSTTQKRGVGESQVIGTIQNKQGHFCYKKENGRKAINITEYNNKASYVTEEIVNRLRALDFRGQATAKGRSMAIALKGKSRNAIDEWNAQFVSNKMHTKGDTFFDKMEVKRAENDRKVAYLKPTEMNKVTHLNGIVRKIEIKKIPGQSLGFFIRKGNGLDRKDGVFISRVSLGSVLDEMGLLHAGDEVLEVNEVSIIGFSLEDVALMMQIPDKLILTTSTTAGMRTRSVTTHQLADDAKPRDSRVTEMTKVDQIEKHSHFTATNGRTNGAAKTLGRRKLSEVSRPNELRSHDRLVMRRRSHSDGDHIELANALDKLLVQGLPSEQGKTKPTNNDNNRKLSPTQSCPVSTLSPENNSQKTLKSFTQKSPRFLRKFPIPSGLRKTKSKDFLGEEHDQSLKEKRSKRGFFESSLTFDRNSKFKLSRNDFYHKDRKLSDPSQKEMESNPHDEATRPITTLQISRSNSSDGHLGIDSGVDNLKHRDDSSSSALGFSRAQRYIKKAKSSQNLSGSEETLTGETTKKSPRTRRSSVNTPPNIKTPLTKKISVSHLMQPFNTLRRKKSEAQLSRSPPQTDINCNDTTDSGLLQPDIGNTLDSLKLTGDQEFVDYDGETVGKNFKLTRGFSGMLSVHVIRASNIPINENVKNCYCNIEVDDEFQAMTSRKEMSTGIEFDESFDIEVSQSCELTLYVFGAMVHSGPESMLSYGKIVLEKLLSLTFHHRIRLNMENGIVMFLRLDYTEAQKFLKRTPSRLHRGVFGFNLVATLDEEENTIPLIVRKCVEQIELRGLGNVGIYRISGNARKKRLLKSEFDRNSASVNVTEDAGVDCNILSGILKDYLRELPEPLISEEMYRSLLNSRERTQSPDLNTRQELLSHLINLIPYTNKGTLIYIMDHLIKVAEHKERNKMDISNLAVCFGPVLMASAPINGISLGVLDFKEQICALEYLLNIWPKQHERGEEVEVTIL